MELRVRVPRRAGTFTLTLTLNLTLTLTLTPAPLRQRTLACPTRADLLVARGAQIIARENELPAPKVGRRPWSATSQFDHRWLTDDDKEKLTELSNKPPPS